jgi:hypothetical protein
MVAVVALAAVVPILVLGFPDGHDIDYHLSCWLDAAPQWRQGIIWPAWAQGANYGFGEPRFLFYPPLSRVMGVLSLLLLPAEGVAAGYIFIVLGIAGACMFALVRGWLPPAHATLAAAFYAVSPYLLLTAYQRNALAELLAQALFPLLLLFAFRLERGTQTIAPLAAAFALIWLSDLPAAVVASYALAFTVALLAVFRRSWGVAWRGAAAIGLGFGLAAFFVLPAAYEQRWVNIAAAIGEDFRPENWQYTWRFDPEAEWFYVVLSTLVFSHIALAAIAGLGTRPWRHNCPTAWQVLLCLAGLSSFMMLPAISGPVWTHLPRLEFVEFPWRWLMVLSTCLALFVAAVLARRRARWLALVLLLLALAGGIVSGGPTHWRRQLLPGLEKDIREAGGYEGGSQFMPPTADPDLFYRNREMPLAVPGKAATAVQVLRWGPERKSLETEAPSPDRVTLHLLSYPAWLAKVDGRPAALSADEMGRTVVSVPEGVHRVEIAFTLTPDRRVGMLVSLAAVLVLGTLAERKSEPRLSPARQRATSQMG